MAALVSFGDVLFFAAGCVAGYYFPAFVAKTISWVREKLKI